MVLADGERKSGILGAASLVTRSDNLPRPINAASLNNPGLLITVVSSSNLPKDFTRYFFFPGDHGRACDQGLRVREAGEPLASMTHSKYAFVVEHLDPELGPWSALEYKTIAKESQDSGCHFILSSVPQSLLKSTDLKEIQRIGGEARTDSIETYYASKKGKICLLDPGASEELNPADAQVFDTFLFGGILGRSMEMKDVLIWTILILWKQETTHHEVRCYNPTW